MNAVVTALKKNPALSVRDVAKKMQVSSSFVQKVRKAKGLRSFKVNPAPNRNDKQNKVAKTRARKLYDKVIKNFDCIIMDDETYVKADFKQIPGRQFYTAKKIGEVDNKYKEKKLDKYPKKYLVWQAICQCGLKSKIFVCHGTINQKIYVEECLQKCLLPLLKMHSGSVLFWPDLASAHYGKLAMEWFENNAVTIVSRDANPPNTPQLRPIEAYWANIKRKLLKTKKCVKNEKEFKSKWQKATDTVTKDDVQHLMSGIKSKLRKFAYTTTN